MEQQLSFGAWLRQRRNAMDLAQWELAERIGCSRDTIQKIESGDRRPSKQVADLLAACVGIPPEDRSAFVNWARLGGIPPVSVLMPISSPAASSSLEPAEPPPPVDLPTPLTSLVGRESEIQAIRGILSREDVRLLSLLGPPGVGKTRLCIAAASQVANMFRDGVHFVALETITDPSLVAATIADVLKIKPSRNQSAQDAVQTHLHALRVLLVLDNFEQVLDAGEDVLELIRTCPGLKVLVTSREALHVYGEWRFNVKPLKLPDVHRLSEARIDTLSNVAAIALFRQRAQATKSDFVLSPDNVGIVADICVRLDGLPLAIELAATRVSSLSLEEIRAGLSQLKLLRGNLRNLPPRQRTIRGAIDWSYHNLSAPERALFRRMGVFVGGCTLAGAELVCHSPDLDLPVEELCEALIEKSLLRHQPGKAKENGEGRYTMLEVLRAYAVEQLQASGEENLVRRRHAQYYTTFVEAAAPRIEGPEQKELLRALEAENDNIRAALEWALGSGPDTAMTALRLSGAFARFWDRRGYAGEGRRWLEQALNATASIAEDARSETDTADAATNPRFLRIRALVAAGSLATHQGDYGAGRSFHEQALSAAQAEGNQRAIATCLLNLAGVLVHMGEYSQELGLYEQALRIFRELDDRAAIIRVLLNMGFAARSRGDNPRARELYEESLALRKELGDPLGIALILGNLGELALDQGDFAEARARLEGSLSLRQELGDERGSAFCLIWLGALDCEERFYTRAGERYRASLELYDKVGDKDGIAVCLEWLPVWCIRMGGTLQGARLWGAAEALRRTIRTPNGGALRARREQDIAHARMELGDEVFMRAWAEGGEMTMKKAIAYALEIIPQMLSGRGAKES